MGVFGCAWATIGGLRMPFAAAGYLLKVLLRVLPFPSITVLNVAVKSWMRKTSLITLKVV
ncbi:Uncharacterised protein [Neisseria gonorrhoeae]|uniref:Uncharacterized protein n=1 Tax=Neisseria gonorrhoeae TaxID=485 RepID=A0A378VWH2_NEIGO|nr:Uncharacterised protein [Neisseria gonorrhoeae]